VTSGRGAVRAAVTSDITNIPTLYTNAEGVQHIDPKLRFAAPGLSLGAR
jgi:hypothetical protein